MATAYLRYFKKQPYCSLIVLMGISLTACESPKEIINVHTFEDFTKVNTVRHSFRDDSALYIKVEGETDGSVGISNVCFPMILVSTNDHYTGTQCYLSSTLHEGSIKKILRENIYMDVTIELNIYPNTARKGKVTVTLVDVPQPRMRPVLTEMGLWEKDEPTAADSSQTKDLPTKGVGKGDG
jgi:hypothetical protein